KHDHGRVTQFLVTAESLLFRIPRPRTLLKLDPNFAEEGFDFGNHLKSKSWYVEALERLDCNAISSLPIYLSTLHPFNAALTTRQEGLEPPTDGFGDRYSTN